MDTGKYLSMPFLKAMHPYSAQLTPRVVAGLCVGVFLLFIQYGVFPLRDWQQTLVRKTVSLKATVSNKKSLIGQDKVIETSLEKASAYQQELVKRFEMNFGEPEALQLNFQKQVEELAASLQIKIVNVDWLPGTRKPVVRVPIKFRMEAVPGRFLDFIYAIENADKFRSVDQIRLATRAKSDTVSVELDISAYGLTDHS